MNLPVNSFGRIAIYDEYSTIDLPLGMPHDMFHELKKVWVAGRQLNISRPGEERPAAVAPPASSEAKPKKPKKPKKAKRKLAVESA